MRGNTKLVHYRFILVTFLLLALLGGSTFSAQSSPQKQGLLPGSTSQKLSKVSHDLLALYQAHVIQGIDGAPAPGNTALPVVGNRVIVDAVASGDTNTLLADLEALGAQKTTAYGRIVSGQLPIDAIDDLDALDSLNFVRPAYATTGVGLVDSQGDAAMNADDARTTWGVDGSGVTVGTLSDSYDCAPAPLTDAATDVANGDLPAGIAVLDDTACPRSDEGRAMMQIIADVAPGASQAFHTAFNGLAGFAQGIEDLATAGAGVIVDDVGYLDEPFFQDGIVAQAVDNVASLGVVYFSSAGNSDRKSYESAFVSSGGPVVDPSGDAHDFDPGAGVDVFQSVTIPVGATARISFQWDQPFFSVSGAPGSANDLDIYLTDEPPTTVLMSSAGRNAGGDPLEIFNFTNLGPATTFNLVIEKYTPAGGSDPDLIKYIDFGGVITVNEYATDSSTVVGHANAEGAVAVGAALYYNTPEFSADPAVLEAFSSAGGTPILFATDGTRLSSPEYRLKPLIVAPDGGNTTFFGSDIADPGDGSDTDTFPNFFGTSAAAPHAAAVAALLLEARASLTPAEVAALLTDTALDMDGSDVPGFPDGFDSDSGYGLIDADAALAQLDTEVTVFLPIVLNSHDASELVENGGFDSGDWTPWQTVGSPQLNDQVYRSASYSARLAGRNNVDSDYVVQEVTVPANATELTLDFWYRVSSSDSASPADYMCVEILDSGFSTVLVSVACFDLYAQSQNQWLNLQSVIDGAALTPLLGQTVLLSFQGWTNAAGLSTVWVDDVSFKVK